MPNPCHVEPGMAWHPDPLQPLELNVDLLLTAQSCWSRSAVAVIRIPVIQWNKIPATSHQRACVPVVLYVSVGLRDCSPGETWQWGTKCWRAGLEMPGMILLRQGTPAVSQFVVMLMTHLRWPDDLFFLSSGFCDRQRLRMKAGRSWQTRKQYLEIFAIGVLTTGW